MERLQRFCLMTGVSKFSKASVFSALNNLTDLTMSPLASTLLGYTHEEVRANFPEALSALAQAAGSDVVGAFQVLMDWYDGYCFDDAMQRVFNPVSLGRSLAESRIRAWWYETGTPSWLLSWAKAEPREFGELEADELGLGTFEPADPNMAALLFQTGYLTIGAVDDPGFGLPRSYRLRYPNREVAECFNAGLARAYVDAQDFQTSGWQMACSRALRGGDAAAFVESLGSFFAAIGYDLTDRLSEQAYQCVAVAILRFIGASVGAEVTTSRGRADMVCRAPGQAFVIELKVASGDAAGKAAAADAIAQIRARGYAEPLRADAAAGRTRVQLLGISFDCNTHNIAAWQAEDL